MSRQDNKRNQQGRRKHLIIRLARRTKSLIPKRKGTETRVNASANYLMTVFRFAAAVAMRTNQIQVLMGPTHMDQTLSAPQFRPLQ